MTVMALHISPDIQARIIEKIETGEYPDADAVLDRALDVLGDVERLNHLRSLLAVGAEQVARGEVIPYTDELREEIKRSARRRFAEGERAGPDVRP